MVAGGLVENLKVPVVESLEPAFTRLEIGIIWQSPCHQLDLSSRERGVFGNQLLYISDNFLLQLHIDDLSSSANFSFGSFLPSANVVHANVEATGDFTCGGKGWQVNKVLFFWLGEDFVLLGFLFLRWSFFLFWTLIFALTGDLKWWTFWFDFLRFLLGDSKLFHDVLLNMAHKYPPFRLVLSVGVIFDYFGDHFLLFNLAIIVLNLGLWSA